MKKLKVNNLTFKKDGLAALCFLTPSMAGFMIFFLIPFIAGIYYSLLDSPVNGSFVGIANYISLLKNPIFRRAAVNTLTFTATCVPLNMMLSLGLALLLNREAYLRNALRTVFISPLVVPVASVVLVWQLIFSYRGSLNAVLSVMGMSPVDWMETEWARVVVLVVYLWKNIGYNIVLFLAGLQNIPSEYYEVAHIDGAGSWKRFVNITLVYLTPTTFFVFIMSIINSFKVFRETYLIAGEYPHSSIYMLQHYMNNMFMSLDYQKLTTAAFIMAAFIYMLVVILFVLERRINEAIS